MNVKLSNTLSSQQGKFLFPVQYLLIEFATKKEIYDKKEKKEKKYSITRAIDCFFYFAT